MPIHIEATEKDVAKVVLLPGNPQRAEYIAKKFFSNPKLYNEYRLMYGFTGKYKGYDISVQTTGMGTPSISIIVEELNMLKVKTMIRVGTCGAINKNLKIPDLVIATAAHSTHAIYRQRFNGANFSASGDFVLTYKLYENAIRKNFNAHAGAILTSEVFYEESMDLMNKFAQYGTLAVEMEGYALFTLAAKYNIKAATVLTVSDTVWDLTRGSKDEIKKGVDMMTELVLDTIIENYDYLTT